jgi:hypothetical protein
MCQLLAIWLTSKAQAFSISLDGSLLGDMFLMETSQQSNSK